MIVAIIVAVLYLIVSVFVLSLILGLGSGPRLRNMSRKRRFKNIMGILRREGWVIAGTALGWLPLLVMWFLQRKDRDPQIK